MTLLPVHNPRLRIIIDPSDEKAHHDAFIATHELHAGRVVCQIRPGSQSAESQAESVLEALGKDFDRNGNKGGIIRTIARCAPWLRAEGVRELVALRAQWLDHYGWRRLIDMSALADCSLTLVLSGVALNRWQQRLVYDWPFEVLSVTAWLDKYGSTAKESSVSGPPREPTDAFPPVPTTDFPLFRATCHRLLDSADFERVDETWRAAHSVTRRWLIESPAVDEAAVAHHLRGLVRPATSFGELITRLRGAQAGFFVDGWLVKVSDERLAASAHAEPNDLLTAHSANLLRGFALPRFGAVATLTLVLRQPPAVLSGLQVRDIAADGSSVLYAGETIAVPEPFRFLLHAQRLERLDTGAAADDPFLAARLGRWASSGQNDVTAMSPKAIRQTLKTVVRETGLLVSTQFSASPANEEAARWAYRRGVSISRIATADTQARRAHDRALPRR